MACPFFDVIAMLDHCTSRYTAGGIHIESYLVIVLSCNSCVVINRSVMTIIIRALPKKKKRPKRKMKGQKKRAMLLSLFPHLCFKVAPCSSCNESHILCFKVAPCSSCSESHILCLKVAPCSSHRLSPMLSLSYTSGNFHYRTWLVYSNDGLPQMP